MSPLRGLAGFVDRILTRRLHGPSGRSIHADLREELSRRTRTHGAESAKRWYLRQGLSVAIWSIFDGVRGRRWSTGSVAFERGTSPSSGTGLMGDFANGFRALRRAPGYAFSVVFTLGLAMGATLSVYTLVDGVLMQPLPYPDPSALVRVDRIDREGNPAQGGVSFPDWQDWDRETETLNQTAAFSSSELTWVAGGLAEVWSGLESTPGLLALLGVRPELGRFYGPDEGAIDERTLFVSHRLWVSRFGADPAIVGSLVELSGELYEIRGVMPEGFGFPDGRTDYWAPLERLSFLDNRNSGFLEVVARTAEGVDPAVAAAEIESLANALDLQHGHEEPPGVALRSFEEVLIQPVRRNLWLFMGAVLFFLLAACTNVAGLGLSRVESRVRELSVRRSLGATRGMIWRQLLAESAALGLVGGSLGLLLSVGGVDLLLSLAPDTLPRRSEIGLDPGIVSVGFAFSLLAGAIVGVLPGFRGTALSSTALRSRGGASRTELRLHRLVAGTQIAVAVVLLCGAGLLMRSFDRLTSTETGYEEAQQVLTFQVVLGGDRWSSGEEILDFHSRLVRDLESLPRVEAASVSSHLPFSGGRLQAAVARDGQVYRRATAPLVRLEVVGGKYFSAMGLGGAGFEFDPNSMTRDVVINESAAGALWPGEEPLGKSFSFAVDEEQYSDPESMYRVVAVIPDALDTSFGDVSVPRAYYSFPQFRSQWGFISGRSIYVSVRTTGPVNEMLIRSAREVVASIDQNVPIRSVMTLEQRMLETALTERLRTLVLGFFALLSILVALVGVHGVIAYGVRRQQRDIGVRLALGASRSDVRLRIVRGAVSIAVVGGGAGLMASIGLAPILDRALYQTSATDVGTFATVALAVLAGTLFAAWIPALRAGRADPVQVMRVE